MGDYVDGKRTSKGKYTWSNGKFYDGDFKDGKGSIGKGTCGWPNGDSYTGQIGGYILTGSGTYKWVDGIVYTGQFKGGLMDGTGTITFRDGSSYSGTWSKGMKNGHGVEHNPKALLRKNRDVYPSMEPIGRAPIKL